jgi:hypothetical protein
MEMTAVWKTLKRVSQTTLENPSGFPHPHSLDGYYQPEKSVTHVSERLLPMSPGQTS